MIKLLHFVLLLSPLLLFSQRPQGQRSEPIKITGTVLDKDTGQPLEYATLVLQSVRNPDKVTGGITNEAGKFDVEILPGRYHISVEYISYITYTLDN
ncbi:MAG: carboxypeptidase regulatory-like domain-containing protein, partial [Saonia sp.]